MGVTGHINRPFQRLMLLLLSGVQHGRLIIIWIWIWVWIWVRVVAKPSVVSVNVVITPSVILQALSLSCQPLGAAKRHPAAS